MSRRPRVSDDPVTSYARDVGAGRVLAGHLVRQACARHLRDLEAGAARGLLWSPERARHAIEFFRDFLILPDGEHAKEPFRLDRWAAFVVGSLHGWFDRDGFRRFKQAYVETGKGSAKTTIGAGLCVYAMVADGATGAQCFTAARTRDQATVPFKDCALILGPDLKARLEVLLHNISMDATGSFIRPVSSEAKNLEGHRVYFALLDELGLHKDGEVVQAMRRGVKGNRNALLFAITNSGEDRESVCWEFHDKSAKVLEGVLEDDEWFAYVCQLDPCARCRDAGHEAPQDGCRACDDWRDEAVWLKTNPSLSVTLPLSYLRTEVKNATEIPSMENNVRRFNFCAWLRSESRWFTGDQWAACAAPVEPEALKGRPCVIGVDLAITDDLAAAVLICPDPDFFVTTREKPDGAVEAMDLAGGVDVLAWAWTCESTANQRIKQGLPYDLWERTGALFVNDGNIIDHRRIRRHIIGLRDQGYAIQEVAFDPAQAGVIEQDLQDEDGFIVVPISQGFGALTAPCMLLEALVKRRQLRHGGNLVLRYAASNVILDRDAGGRMRPSKAKSSGKIDPIAALVTGLKRLNATARTTSVYESRGLVTTTT